jgi:autotransporter-associated beta strand protein
MRAAVTACAAAVPLAAWSSAAHAQTWVSPIDGLWSNPANWSAPPVSGSTTDLIFPSADPQSYIATNDFPGPFVLRNLSFTGTSTGSVSVSTGSLSTLQFAGLFPNITSSATGPVFLNGRASLGTFTNVNASGPGALTINASLLGPRGLTIANSGALPVTLASGNTISGVTLNSGRLNLGAQTSLGSGTFTAFGGTLETSLAPALPGNPPLRPTFVNPIFMSSGGVTIGGENGYALSGNIQGSVALTFSPTNTQNATWTLSGNNTFSGAPLNVNGSPTPGVISTLVINSPASLGNPFQINLNGAAARLAFVSASTPVTINQPIVLGSSGGALGALSVTTDSQVTYAGNITGAGGLTRSLNGFVTLSGANSFNGPLTLTSGTTIVSNEINLGIPSSTLVLNGGALQLNAGFGTTNRPVQVAQPGSIIYVAGDASFGGIISGAAGLSYTKSGAGNLNLLSANTYAGNVTISGGTITASTSTGRINNGVATVTINSGGAFTADNTAANATRITSGSTISLQGGTVRLIGNATVNSSLTTTGQLILGTATQTGAGPDSISVTPGASANAAVRFGSISRTTNNGSTMLFTGPGLGANTIASLTPGASNISFTAAPTLTNNILPYAIADATGGPGTDFATYSAANGVMPFTATVSNLTSGAATNPAVVNDAAAPGGSTVNSLKLLGGTVDATNTLTISSGAILATGASTISGGTLNLGTAGSLTGNIFAVADLGISSRINTVTPAAGQPTGIAKAGPGILTLTGPQTYVGPTRVLAGTLRLGTANGIPATSEVFIAPGATLDCTAFSGFSVTIGSLNQTEATQTIGNNPHGTVNIGFNTLVVGGDNNSTTINTNLAGTGTLTKTGSGTMTVIGNQSFTGSINLASGALVLGTHASDGTGLRNATRINLGIPSISGDAVLGFNFGLRDGFAVPITAAALPGRTASIKVIRGAAGTPGVTLNSNITISSGQGVIIDSSGGMTLAGTINGSGPLITATTDDDLANGPDGFAVNITGSNSYSGATTLTAVSTLFGNAFAFGATLSAIGLGGTNGADNPELSSSVGGLTLTRNITVNDSFNGAAQFAVIGSQVPAGSGTTTYSGNISIAGARKRLVLYSRYAPVAFNGVISGVPADANVQIGDTLGPGMEWTNSNVTLAGANTYAGGTRVVTGTLNFGSSTATSGPTILSGPVGTGVLTIGSPTTVGASAEPTLVASGAPRTLANPLVMANNFSVAGTNALTFTGAADLGGASRFVTINSSAPVTFAGAISGVAGSALVKDGPGTLVLSGTNTYAGPTVAAGGTLTFAATQMLGGLLAVAGGATANLTVGANKVIVVPSLYIESATGSRLDLADNNLIVDYTGASPIAQVAALITSGYAAGAWTGPGITSSTAASVSAHAVGFGEAAALGISNFAGQPVDGDAVLARYTRYGDATLDGIVNLSDFNKLAANFGTSGKYWYQADFNYDGTVNLADFNLLAANFGLSAGADGVVDPSDWAALAAAVPEPLAISLPFAALVVFAPRRRRQRTQSRFEI